MNNQEKIYNNFSALGFAVVRLAVQDFQQLCRVRPELLTNAQRQELAVSKNQILDFFRSDYGRIISQGLSDEIINKLEGLKQ